MNKHLHLILIYIFGKLLEYGFSLSMEEMDFPLTATMVPLKGKPSQNLILKIGSVFYGYQNKILGNLAKTQEVELRKPRERA